MNWHFCPHCETQLDEETFICPACRWDPLAVAPEPEQDQTGSLVDRYRGTQYDSSSFDAAMVLPTHKPTVSNRARTVVVVGLLAILGLYGSMMMYSDMQTHQDRPAAIGAPR